MDREAKRPPMFSVGERVLASVGTKRGYGIIASLSPGFATVEFPDCPYPQSMVQPTGTYFVALRQIEKVRR
jgi:hypothetical protein